MGKAIPTSPAPQLPKDHVGDHPLFAVTGIDFAGPLYASNASTPKESYKVYFCLFMCDVTCAIYLELTVDLTAESFLQAFHCFAS